jgi:hypothetical protein
VLELVVLADPVDPDEVDWLVESLEESSDDALEPVLGDRPPPPAVSSPNEPEPRAHPQIVAELIPKIARARAILRTVVPSSAISYEVAARLALPNLRGPKNSYPTKSCPRGRLSIKKSAGAHR